MLETSGETLREETERSLEEGSSGARARVSAFAAARESAERSRPHRSRGRRLSSGFSARASPPLDRAARREPGAQVRANPRSDSRVLPQTRPHVEARALL